MPHAEKDTVNGEMTTRLTNGEKPQSKVLSVCSVHPSTKLKHSIHPMSPTLSTHAPTHPLHISLPCLPPRNKPH